MSIKSAAFKIIHALMGAAESAFLALYPERSVPTVWIIGPPRSGTTLLYQALLRRYRFAYFTNFIARFPKAPVLAALLARLFVDEREAVIDFQSDYGRTAHRTGPHEAGPFWYRFFPKGEGVYVPPGSTSRPTLRAFEKEIAAFCRVVGAPGLFKNTYNSMRIAPLAQAFPSALFLVCRRDPLDTAQSILNGRLKLYGDKSAWMGVPPQEYGGIKDHPYWEQVAEQVYYVYRQIETDKSRFGAERFLDVDYARLCLQPAGVLEEIERALAGRDVRLEVVGDAPESFPFSSGRQVDERDYERIRRATAALWA